MHENDGELKQEKFAVSHRKAIDLFQVKQINKKNSVGNILYMVGMLD